MKGLPPIRRDYQWRAMALGYIAFSALYLGAAAIAIAPAQPLAPAAIDRAIPFIDWTVWIYLTQYALLAAAIVLARDDADRTQAFYSMLAATAIAALIFAVWPTHIERQTQVTDGLTGLVWSGLYFADTPLNCFPSLHVALAVIAGTTLWRRGSRLLAVFWPALIAISTLTTKQHVFMDVAGGGVLAASAWFTVSHLIQHERTQQTPETAGV